jgi:hypothetical protein
VKIEQKVIDRFFRNVNKYSDPAFSELFCWDWKGYKNKKGYGKFGIGREVHYAHRVSWEIANGTPLSAINVCHKCDNPSCVNPSHLFIGTQSDNLNDASVKGRTSRGESRPAARLTEESVREIIQLHRNGEILQRQLAGQFGVSIATINNIVNKNSWKHIKR